MKTSLSLTAKIYIMILGLAALGLLGYLFFITRWSGMEWLHILLFLFVTFFSDSFPVRLPRGVVVSVGFAVTFATILIFDPLIVVLIAVLGDLFSLRKGRSLIQRVFNAAQITLSTGIAALVFQLLNPGPPGFALDYLAAALVTLLICFILNSFFITLIIALTGHERPYSVWLSSMKWSMPSFISMAPLGLIIVLVFMHIGIWGLVLLFIPMIVARQSFISYTDMRQTLLDTIQSLSATIDAKDPYTRGHSARVAAYATALARELGWNEEKIELLQYVALIHDLGKVVIPESILNKEGELVEAEFDRMKEHSSVGYNIIKDVSFLSGGAEMIKHHHERWDGKGYPDGLEGEHIPEGARILAVADAFDAMTSNRLYRKALGFMAAVQEIKEGAGAQFDPHIAEVFIRIAPRLNNYENMEGTGDIMYSRPVAAETEH